MFRAMRMQMDQLGFEPDHRVNGLKGLPGLLGK
jgi:hypothetical protein